MSELVSIVIPAFTAERWIGDTIRSALAQTWPNKEIIVVDDGSSDRTLEIAKTFESKTVKVIAQRNTGACGARNAALAIAQGSYIQFLDADDLLAPDKISRQLKESEPGSDSQTLLTASWGRFFHCAQRATFMPDSLWQDLLPVEWILRKFTENSWMNPVVWLVSRRLAELVGPWDERLSASGDDDGEYMCRLVARSERIRFVAAAKCYYRIGQGSSLGLSSQKSAKALQALFLSTCLCIEHLRALEDSERTRRASVAYLQQRFHYFYPEQSEIVNEACMLARSLGGDLVPPSERLKFRLIEKIVGRNTAKHLRSKLRGAESVALRSWDKLVCSLFNA